MRARSCIILAAFLAAFVAAACAHPAAAPEAMPAAPGAAAPAEAPPAEPPPSASPPPASRPVPHPPAHHVGPPGVAAPAPPPVASAPGDVHIEGCLAKSSAGESLGAEFPAPATRGPPVHAVTLTPRPGAVVVSDAFAHACCLAGAVEVAHEDGVAVVREKLSGTPCRCLCRSHIDTTVAASPGTARVRVVLEDGAGSRTVYEGSAEVP